VPGGNKLKHAVVIKTKRLRTYYCSITYCRSKKNTEALLYANKEVAVEVNPDKTEYMLMSRSQKVGQKHSIKIQNRSFEEVIKFKYLGTALKSKNCIDEEINSRLNSGNACCHSVQSLLSSRLLSWNVKAKIYKTIILSVVLYGCETWSLTLREEHRLRVFENRVLRGILGPKRDEGKVAQWELHILYSSPDIIRQINSRRMRAWHVARMGEGRNVYRILVGKPEGKRPLRRPMRRWENGIRTDLTEIGWEGGEWIRLAQDVDRWRTVVNAAMNLPVLAPRS
jgi:hypothetical protein